jgi:hypothetical protein
MTSALEHLARHLQVPAEQVPALGTADEAHVATYDAMLTAAMRREDEAMARALEDALEFVPRLLRPVAKKMLGGEHG